MAFLLLAVCVTTDRRDFQVTTGSTISSASEDSWHTKKSLFQLMAVSWGPFTELLTATAHTCTQADRSQAGGDGSQDTTAG